MAERKTVTAWARAAGICVSSAHRARTAGRIDLGPDGLVDPVEASRHFADRTRPKIDAVPRPALSGNGHESSYRVARSEREAVLAKLAEIEFGVKSGRLMSVDDVRHEAFDAARRTRNALLAIPARLAPVLAGVQDPAKVQFLLRAEFERALAHLPQNVAAKPKSTRDSAPRLPIGR